MSWWKRLIGKAEEPLKPEAQEPAAPKPTEGSVADTDEDDNFPETPEEVEETGARKLRSDMRLKAEGVPVLDWLPRIEPASRTRLRTPQEVVARVMALVAVAGKGATQEQPTLWDRFVGAAHGAVYSAREQAFLDNPIPSDHDFLQFSWRVEASVPLLWALGAVERLERPDCPIVARNILALTLDDEGTTLAQKETLRPIEEILDEADLIYRYHWATRQAGMSGAESPAGLDPGVVQERHQALNWLICYNGEDNWDLVGTDT
jgi:hypothetical protein